LDQRGHSRRTCDLATARVRPVRGRHRGRELGHHAQPANPRASICSPGLPWQKQFFENGAAAFEDTAKRRKAQADAKDRRIAALEDKLRRKNEVLAELTEEHGQLKKELGEP
jgi:hypothetical protein